uniref:Jasmonate O-methyltransferase n=1 Tax=Oryza rufipogon TaxID=4529 RepID=A0A0E0PVN0_ORYRU
MINTERDFHMVGGEGEISYARNSRVQNKAMMETKSILDKFFLNDLPGNDFNHLFRTLETFKKANETNHEGEIVPAYYICGVPGSYYTRLFPQQTIHLFHSSISLHWLSQVPEELNGRKKVYLNEENIYITKTTPQSVVKLFQEQFYKDFSLFLTLRHEELVLGGQMENLESFNLPLYGPSVGEVDEIVKNVNLFEMDHINLFECNWDPYDDSQGDIVHDSALSGMNVAKCIRAALQPLIASYFGEDILNALFEEYAHRVAKHLEKEKGKFAFIVVSLKKRCYIKIGS